MVSAPARGPANVQTEFEFSVSLNTDERPDVDLVRETLFDVQKMLCDIERQATSGKPGTHWLWDQPDPRPTSTASVNGVRTRACPDVPSRLTPGGRDNLGLPVTAAEIIVH
jgi:hypothetical protein